LIQKIQSALSTEFTVHYANSALLMDSANFRLKI
jgi:hypothetical protein